MKQRRPIAAVIARETRGRFLQLQNGHKFTMNVKHNEIEL